MQGQRLCQTTSFVFSVARAHEQVVTKGKGSQVPVPAGRCGFILGKGDASLNSTNHWPSAWRVSPKIETLQRLKTGQSRYTIFYFSPCKPSDSSSESLHIPIAWSVDTPAVLSKNSNSSQFPASISTRRCEILINVHQ